MVEIELAGRGNGVDPDSPYNFIKIPEDNKKIWRYVDFPQFMSIVANGYIWLTQAENFDDPFEGSLPEETIKERRNQPKYPLNYQSKNGIEADYSDYREMYKKCTFVNSWHVNDNESAAMWDIYSEREKGIAIQSTYGDLTEAISPNGHTINISQIEYIDFSEDGLSSDELDADPELEPFLYKRESFEYEHELRVIIQDEEEVRDADGNLFLAMSQLAEKHVVEFDSGKEVEICPETLINSVYISPESEGWIRDLVSDVLNKYGIDAPVKKSSLADNPSY